MPTCSARIWHPTESGGGSVSDHNKQILKELFDLMLICQIRGFKDADKVIEAALGTLSLMVSPERIEK